MKFPFLMAAALVLGSTAVQAEGSAGGTSHGSSSGISRSPSSGMAGTATQQNFGASPGAPGSPSYNPNAGMSGSTLRASPGIGSFGASPGAPGSPSFNSTTARGSRSAPNATIPTLDEVMPGASKSGLLGSSASGTNSSGSGAE